MYETSAKNLRLVNYLLLVCIAGAVLLLIRDVMTSVLTKSSPSFPVKKAEAEPPTARKGLMQYAPVLQKNPFGKPMELRQLSSSQESSQGMKDLTTSDLALIGTAVGSEKFGYAVFEDKSHPGQQEVFSIGDNVFDYGRLKSIGHTSAVIERNSSTFTVTMPELSMVSDDGGQVGEDERASAPSFAKKIGEREYVLDGRRVQKSLENPEQILTDARLLPNIKDGRQEGFTISEVIPGGIYHSLGLRNGDILLRINSLEISNPEVAIQAMTALRGMNTVNLDIVRNGQPLSMNYRIK